MNYLIQNMNNIILLTLSCIFACFQLPAAPPFFISTDHELCNTLWQRHKPVSHTYDVKFYFIDLEVYDSTTYIQGSTTILVKLLDADADQIILDMGNNLHTDSVFLNGKQTNYLHTDDKLAISSSSSESADYMMSIRVFYHGRADKAGNFAGIYNASDREWDKKATWTLSEPFSARNWFPCKQVLSDKADSVYVFITTDKNLKAGSNGLLTSETPMRGNKIRYEWKSRYPVAFYLISFSVSDYRDYSFYIKYGQKDDSLLVQNYIYNNDSFYKANKSVIDKTADIMLLFTDLFGPYPFAHEKYGHCIVPSGGGMEHQTMTTLEDFSFALVGHELAHQWFGNYVTCSTWQDIWVNEGFASYAEYLCYQYLTSQKDADRWMTSAHHIAKYSNKGSVYIPEDEVHSENRIFNYSLSYKKGAAIVHMIRHEIHNDSLFFETLKNYLNKYQNSTATGIDFKNILEQNTGISFKNFFDQWYFGEGYPVIDLHLQHRNDTLYINANQQTTASTPLFNVLIDFRIRVNGIDTTITRRQLTNQDKWSFYIPGRITRIQADPDQWLLADIVYNNDISGIVVPDNEQHISNCIEDLSEHMKGTANIAFIEP